MGRVTVVVVGSLQCRQSVLVLFAFSNDDRTHYCKEFKLDAIRIYENGEHSQVEIEHELGIAKTLLGKWQEAFERQPKKEKAFPGNGRLTETEARIRQLERENVLLKQAKEILKKSAGDVLQGRQMSYRFIQHHEQAHAVGRMCMLVRIYRSSYYAWKRRKPGQRQQENEALIEHIRRIHKLSRRTYGSPRVVTALFGI